MEGGGIFSPLLSGLYLAGLTPELLDTLLLCLTGMSEQLQLPSMLQNRTIWLDVLVWCGWGKGTTSSKFNQSQLGRLLGDKMMEIAFLAKNMASGRVQVKQMRWILKNKHSKEGLL